MKKELPKKSVFALIFLLFVIRRATVIIVNQGAFYLPEWLGIVWFVLGGMIGALTLFGDRLLDIYIVNPETKLAVFAKRYFAQNKNREGVMIIQKNKEMQKRLYMHSALFQVIWVVLAVFGVLSTSVAFGKGYVMGLGLWLILDEWEEYINKRENLKNWLFWQINKDFNDKELKIYLIIMTIIWAFLYGKIVF